MSSFVLLVRKRKRNPLQAIGDVIGTIVAIPIWIVVSITDGI